ncbi:MAG: vWA domain-containing protein [Chloroflexota bacterium]
MSLFAPLALLFGLSLPVVVLFYLLKVRRTERDVSSILLWETLRRDLAAHEPWQKLRWSILLILQLILLAILTVALSRPSIVAPAPSTRFMAIIVDTSASMLATDVLPNRFERARSAARELVDGLPDGTSAAVIAAGATAQVVVPETSDGAALDRGLAALRATDTDGDSVDSALRLAGALAHGRPDASVHLFSDGAYPHPPEWDDLTNLNLRFHQFGTPTGNQAITALATRSTSDPSTSPSSDPRQLFARVQSFDPLPRSVNVTLTADGQPVESRAVDLPADGSSQLFFTDLPPDARVIQLQLDQRDALEADNRAILVRGATPTTSVLLVTRGNLFLQKALESVPGVTLYQVTPRSYPTVDTTPYGVLVFDGFLPDRPPGKNSLIVDPSDAPWLPLEGVVRAPPITLWRNDDPTLAYVDLRSIQIARASNVKLPDWAYPLIQSNGVALGFAGDDNGARMVGLTFNLQQSNLPLSPAFPIFVSNVMRFLTPTVVTQSASLAPGNPAIVQARPGVGRVVIGGPSGQSWTIVPSGGVARFDQTDQVGLYQATEYVGSQSVDVERFAVNLFDPAESDLRPRADLVDRAAPVASSSIRETPVVHEYAWFLLLLAVPLMLGEWWWFHRR